MIADVFCVSIVFLVIVCPIFPFSSYSGFARNQYQLISLSWWQTCHLDHHSHLLLISTIDHAIVANCWIDPVLYLFKFCPNPVDPGRCYFGTVGPITLCFLLSELLSFSGWSMLKRHLLSVVFAGQKTRWVLVEMCLSLRVKSVKSIWDHYWGPNFDPIHHLKWGCPPNHPKLDHVDPFWYWNLWFWRSLILRHLHWYCGWSPFLITRGNDSNIYESVLLFLRSAGAAMGLEGAHLVPGTIWHQRGDVSKPCDSEQFLRAAISIFLLVTAACNPWHGLHKQIDTIFWPIDLSLHSRSLVRTAPDRSPKPWKHRPYLGEPWSHHTYKILSLPYRQKCCWSVTLI